MATAAVVSSTEQIATCPATIHSRPVHPRLATTAPADGIVSDARSMVQVRRTAAIDATRLTASISTTTNAATTASGSTSTCNGRSAGDQLESPRRTAHATRYPLAVPA